MSQLKQFIESLNFKGMNPDKSYVTTSRPPQRIFLCGGNDGNINFRPKLKKFLEDKGCNVLRVEDVLSWYNSQHFGNDLLELEKYYAALVSVIPIVCESMGSAAELGAFVHDPYIRQKLYIIIKKKYYSGEESESFIRYGPIESYEKHVSRDGSGIYEIDNENPEKNLEGLASAIIEHQPKQTICNFREGYYQVLLLIDIINILIVSDAKEIKEHFKYALKCAFPESNEYEDISKEFERRFSEMLFVLEKLGLLKERRLGTKYYIAKHRDLFLEYNKSKKQLNSPNVVAVRKNIESDIYSNKALSKNKLLILKEEKELGEISWLLKKTSLESLGIRELLATAPLQYKVYEIPKKTGGTRTIAQPTAQLKELQRSKVKELELEFLIHKSATAYIKNKNGILENATIHQDNSFFYKFDFKNFFPSIKARDFNKYLEKHGYNTRDRIDYLKIFFRFDKSSGKEKTRLIYKRFKDSSFNKNDNPELLKLLVDDYTDEFQLSVGAPSSPFISNIIMYDFDRLIFAWAEKNGLKYSRYADDLTFSATTKIDLKIIEKSLEEIIKKIDYPSLIINHKKTKFVSFKSRVSITGLNITPDKQISIGRNRKKEIRAMVHYYQNKKLSNENIDKLRGWLSYSKAVEPDFIRSLEQKYTSEIIEQIFKMPVEN